MKTYLTLLICVTALLGASPTRADIITATLKFTRTQDILAEADRSVEKGDTAKALTLYKYALNAFTEIIAKTPDFQPDMIEFRMAYCDGRIATLLDSMHPVKVAPHPPATNSPPPSVTTSEDVVDLLALARDHLEDGESDAARAQILQGFKLDPDNVNLRLLAGLAQCQARRFGDAIFILKELAIETPSNAPIHVGLAAALFGDGQRKAAIATLKTAITLEPTLAEAHYNMAQILLAGADPDREAAYTYYQQALALGGAPDPRLDALFKGDE